LPAGGWCLLARHRRLPSVFFAKSRLSLGFFFRFVYTAKCMKKTMGLVGIAPVFGLILAACPVAPRGVPSVPPLPQLAGTVTIYGEAMVGERLWAGTELSGTGELFFQWRRGTANVGADINNYVVMRADIGYVITVVVVRQGHAGAVVGGPTDIVVDGDLPPLPDSARVSIDGSPVVGQVLTANTDQLDGTGAVSFQWLRGEPPSAIARANNATYRLQPADLGQRVSVLVSRANHSTRLRSATVGPVVGPGEPYYPDPPSVSISISFANFQDLGPTVPDQTVSIMGEESLRFTVETPELYDSITWYLNGVQTDDEVDGDRGEFFDFVPYVGLMGINSLTVMVEIGGRTYSTVIRVTVMP